MFLGISALSLAKSKQISDVDKLPQLFLPQHIDKGQLAHAGIFNANGTEYYLTISDNQFQQFNVLVSKLDNG